MLVDGLNLIDGVIVNAHVEQVTAFPTTLLTPGRMIYLTTAVGSTPPGLYVTNNAGTFDAATSSSAIKQTLRNTTVGTLAVKSGIRLYPAATMTLASVFGSVSTVSVGADIQVDIKQNGVSILGGSFITITAGTNKSPVLANTSQILTTDYLTVDIIQVGSTVAGSDLVVTIYYS